MLAVDPLAIHDHIKDATTSSDEFRIHIKSCFQFSR